MTDKEKLKLEQSDIQKSDLEFLKKEINKADLEADEKIKLTQEVDGILEKLEKDTNIKDLGKSIQEIKDKIPVKHIEGIEKIESKKLNTLTFDEAKIFAYAVFGDGPGTDLLIKLSDNKPYMISRIVSLALLEGGLQFGRKNPGPVVENGKIVMKGEDRTTFQLHENTPQETKKKFETCLSKGKKLCEENKITADKLNYTQADLISWLGYNLTRTNGNENLNKLSQDLSTEELKKLIGTDIQGGISDNMVKGVKGIGTKVLENLDKTVGSYITVVEKNKKTSYEKYTFDGITDGEIVEKGKKSEKDEKGENERKGIKGRFRSLFPSWTGVGLLNKTGLGSKIKTFFTDSFMGKIAGNIGIGKFLKTIFEKIF